MVNNPANYDYHSAEHAAPTSPYGSGDPYYNKSSGYIASGPAKQQKKNWLKIGIPIALLVIIGAVVGGVLGSRASKKNNADSTGNAGSNGGNSNGNGNNPVKNGLARLPSSTDPVYGVPIYPSSVSFLCYPPSNVGISRCLTLSLCHFSPDDRTLVLPLSTTRPTLPSMASRRSPQVPSSLGPATTLTLAPRRLPACAQIDLDLSPPVTDGKPFQISSRTRRTSRAGTILL